MGVDRSSLTMWTICWFKTSSGASIWRVVARRHSSYSASPKIGLWKLGRPWIDWWVVLLLVCCCVWGRRRGLAGRCERAHAPYAHARLLAALRALRGRVTLLPFLPPSLSLSSLSLVETLIIKVTATTTSVVRALTEKSFFRADAIVALDVAPTPRGVCVFDACVF